MSKNVQIGILYKTEHGLNVKWILEETKEKVTTPQKKVSQAGDAT